MSGESKDKAARQRGESAKDRDTRLAAALRANLLKRKAQARARPPPKPCDEGGQGKS